MQIPPTLHPFWASFEAASGRDMKPCFYEAFHFDDNEDSANALARLVLTGTKRATASLLRAMQADNKTLPKPGDLSVVTDWQGQALCVIETRSVEIVLYDQVSEAFAATEGEGDGSLACWRDAHWAYFGRQCHRIGRQAHLQMPVVCERFEVVYRPGL